MKGMNERVSYFSIVVGRSLLCVCERKQAGQIYRRFLPFLTLKRQREREEEKILSLRLLAIQRATRRSLCREEYRASNIAAFRFDFPSSSSSPSLPVYDEHNTKRREKEKRWKRSDVLLPLLINKRKKPRKIFCEYFSF